MADRNKLPYFPFDVADYLNNSAVAQMGADTEGCFIRCLARSWQTSTPGIIADALMYEFCGMHRLEDQYRVVFAEKYGATDPDLSPDALCRDRIEQVDAELQRAFDLTSQPGFWVQKRMVREFRQLSGRLVARQAGAAKTNGIKEASRSTNGNRNGHRPVTARRPAEEVEVEVEVDLQESKSKTKPSRSLRSPGVDFSEIDLPDWMPRETWCEWTAHRKEQHQPLTERAAKLCLSKLDSLRGEGDDPKSVVEQSIASGWTGLFALGKQHTNGSVAVVEVSKTKRMFCPKCYGSYFVLAEKASIGAWCDKCMAREA